MDRRLLFFLVLASVFVSGDAMAATDLSHADTSVQGLLDLVLQQSHQWSGKLYDYAIRLFWLLASIQFIWTFMPLVMKQADFGEIVGELLRFVLVVGFFLAVMKYSVEWSSAIVDSFRDAAASASGLGRALEPGDMLAVALDFGRTMVKGISVFSPAKGLLIAVCAILVLACFAFIAVFMFVTLVESYVTVLFFGFGGSQWTRDFAIAPMRFTVAIGAKLFVLTLIVGLIVQSAKQWLAAYTNDEASLMTMVGLALVCCYLTKTIPDLIGGMISGTSMGGGSAIGGMAAAGAAGAAAAIATIATAGAAAPAAAGALGAAGSSGATGAGAAGAGGGLAGAINSSFAGASSAGGAAPSVGGGTPIGVGANTGGGAVAKTASSAGVKTGGGAATQSATPSSGTQQAAKQAGKATQTGDDNDQKAIPKGEAVSSGNALSQAANGGAKALGVIASLTVPGMENAHSASLGAGLPQPAHGDSSSLKSAAPAAEAPGMESNVIRPDTNTSSNSGRTDVSSITSSNDQPEK
ncbi:P-type conjugative transfer protein TrbL [Pseudomonas putida]|uniref:P-type conjugative transfer protein TrbL n=1 Tax=Pseudomonas putida TaxID=303 RepID=UPI00105A955B|nr:P-type conjugative transfer protein TrbL [Pseudomonas putida]TDJ77782.1 P-type conjugative transfer protein TrbL [Pseudomonas putida]